MLLLGVIQAQAAGQAAGSFDLLETQVLSSSAASVTFSGLSAYAADYQHLQIRVAGSTDRADSEDIIKVALNGTNAGAHRLLGNGGTVSSGYEGSPYYRMIYLSGNSNSSIFGAAVVDILDPFNSNKNTTVRALSGNAWGSGGNNSIALGSTALFSTTALSSISFAAIGNFRQYSRFSIYGLKVGA